MTEAIFGLIGVLVGGLLNGGISWLGERRRLMGGVKVAARLVVSELEVNQVVASTAVEAGHAAPLKSGSVDEWRRRRETLASVLTDAEWSGLDNYFLYYEHLRSTMAGHALDDDGKDDVRSLMEKGAASLKALRRYAGEDVAVTQGVELEKEQTGVDQS